MADWLAEVGADAPKTALAERMERDARILALRRKGYTIEHVVAYLAQGSDGYPPIQVGPGVVASVYRDYMRHRAAAIQDDVATARALTIDRLDAIIRTHSDLADEGNIRSAEIIMKAERQRAELLGLNAAQQIEHHHGGDVRVSLGIDPEEIRREREAAIAAGLRSNAIDGSAEEVR